MASSIWRVLTRIVLLIIIAASYVLISFVSGENSTEQSSYVEQNSDSLPNKSFQREANPTMSSAELASPIESGTRESIDDWSLERKEYDLLEYIQDLNAKFKNILPSKSPTPTSPTGSPSQPPILNEPEEALQKEAYSPSNQDEIKTQKIYPSRAPEVSTSLASDDHEIAGSSWQYGIFDRFTRAKSTTAKPTTPDSSLASDLDNKLDVRNFNSDECGLRTYLEEQASFSYPQSIEEESSKQRRQKIPLSPMDRKKLESVMMLINSSEQRRDENKRVAEFDKTGLDIQPQPSDSTGDSEFNLASRRLWLQQQLGNTLQMLGLNSTSNEDSEIGLDMSSNHRENMMRKSQKLGKSNDMSKDSSPTLEQLVARQDEMKLEARVIGGSDARLGDSPWSVSLQALVSRPGTGAVEYRHYCGGTIISEHYVLTAAHCLDFMVGRESRLFVVVGDLNWRMSAASMYGRRFGIEKLIIHSGYKSTAFGHDIGLIKTKESMKPLKVNGKYIVNSVCLPNRNIEHSGEAELVGWGLFSNRNEMADSLQIVDVPILPRPLCVDLYRRRTGLIQWLIGIELITDKQVCAGTFGRGICQGDSGSALVVNERLDSRNERLLGRMMKQGSGRDGKQSRATIIGVVAFGGIRRCSYQSLPGVYMQTSKYMDWILPRIQP